MTANSTYQSVSLFVHKEVTCGVLQGSILGPAIFFYVKRLASASKVLAGELRNRVKNGQEKLDNHNDNDNKLYLTSNLR